MMTAAPVLDFREHQTTRVVSTPVTVGELRRLLAGVPDHTRLFDPYSQPPAFELHYGSRGCEYVEVTP